jgi:hypothetical protein
VTWSPLSVRWVAFLLGGALIARIAGAIAIGNAFRFADEALYVDSARHLAGGAGFGAGYAGVPAYPVFLTLLSLGLPVSIGFLRVAQAAVAAIGSLLVYALAERTFGRRVAVAAGLAYAFDPLLVITSGLLYPETVAAVLLTAIILLALQASERDLLTRSLAVGGLLGVLAQLRPVALILPLAVGAWMAVTVESRPARRLAHLATLALAFSLVLTPWITRNYRIHREFVPVTTHGTHAAPVDPDEVDRKGLLAALAHWAWTQPGDLLTRVGRQFLQFWELTPTRLTSDDPETRNKLHQKDPRLSVSPLFDRGLRDLVSAASFAVELLLALAGIAVVFRSNRRASSLILAVILAWALGYALFVAKLRYRIPILPLLFLFSGAGAAAVYSLLRPTGRNHRFLGS